MTRDEVYHLATLEATNRPNRECVVLADGYEAIGLSRTVQPSIVRRVSVTVLELTPDEQREWWHLANELDAAVTPHIFHDPDEPLRRRLIDANVRGQIDLTILTDNRWHMVWRTR